MTIDEAIQHCKEQVQEQAKKGCYSCAEEHQQLAEWLKELKAYKEQSGDAISRQAVFEQIAEWIISGEYGFTNATDYLSNKIKALPSVTPQQMTGRWIDAEVLDKIRAEIDEQYDRVYPYDISCAEGLEMALGIIDKYREPTGTEEG